MPLWDYVWANQTETNIGLTYLTVDQLIMGNFMLKLDPFISDWL